MSHCPEKEQDIDSASLTFNWFLFLLIFQAWAFSQDNAANNSYPSFLLPETCFAWLDFAIFSVFNNCTPIGFSVGLLIPCLLDTMHYYPAAFKILFNFFHFHFSVWDNANNCTKEQIQTHSSHPTGAPPHYSISKSVKSLSLTYSCTVFSLPWAWKND